MLIRNDECGIMNSGSSSDSDYASLWEDVNTHDAVPIAIGVDPASHKSILIPNGVQKTTLAGDECLVRSRNRFGTNSTNLKIFGPFACGISPEGKARF